MNAPFTPFEQVFAVLSYLANLPDALNKSTQEWMEETRKNLAALEKQIAEGMAEYERVETEAFAVLTRGGWLGMERHLTGPQVRTILQTGRRRSKNSGHNSMWRL